MERKNFLRNSIGLLGSGVLLLEACKKAAATTTTTGTGSGSCIVTPEEVEGPYPYASGEINNPLLRNDITGGQTGVPLTLALTIVNTNNNCAAVCRSKS